MKIKKYKKIFFFFIINFLDDDNGSLSLFEFFNSFRDSNSSPYPLVKSKETKDALEMIKRIKNELSSGRILCILYIKFNINNYKLILILHIYI